MISNQLTKINVFSTNELNKIENEKLQIEKYLNFSSNNNIPSITDDISQINTNQSTYISWNYFSQSNKINNSKEKEKSFNNSNLILTKHIHRSTSTSNCIDWTNHHHHHQSNTSATETTINNQLNAINFLQEYLQYGNSDVLIDLIYEIAEEINKHNNNSNNNHFHLTPTFYSNLQLSNNKEKKLKKENSNDKEKKDSKEKNKDYKKKENDDNEMISKKPKKKKEKLKKPEETTTTTTTTDSEHIIDSPALINPTRINYHNSKSSPYSPTETTGYPSFSIPVPHSIGSSTNGFISPDSSHIRIPQQSNSMFAHLSQVQHQLQTDPNKSIHSNNMSIQQQLQSLSQMARDGDEILITLNVNTLTQKQQMNNNIQQYQSSFPINSYSTQPWNQIMSSSTDMTTPRNIEIVAKGFARVQNEHPQPPPLNPQQQQQQSMLHSYTQSPFIPRYPNPCYSNSGPPQIPIGPPIQPIFPPPNIMMSNGFIRPSNNVDLTSTRNRSHINNEKCDYLCQSSLYQPDFRGRPSPGIITNPYMLNSISPMNFSAKKSSKTKFNQSYTINSDTINRTYSSIY